jgi:hypothetical protein
MKTNLFCAALYVFCYSTTSATVHYVDLNSAQPIPPFISWATAATTIQAAVDAAVAGDEIVVTNGTYALGGRAIHGTMTNRVAVDQPLTLRSVNGPQFTVIQGAKSPDVADGIRCVYLTNNASLVGFMLTNGGTRLSGNTYLERSGGGAWCEPNAMISNCVVVGNWAANSGGGLMAGNATVFDCYIASNSAYGGGGTFAGTLNNCILTANAATYAGGGASSGNLNNCLLTKNSATYGGATVSADLNSCTVVDNSATSYGGIYSSRATNCIVYFNSSPNFPNYDAASSLFNYCCTIPMPSGGLGNIPNDPGFSNFAAGNFNLTLPSTCINAGTNPPTVQSDLEGNPRLVEGLIDIGAYEFQGPSLPKILQPPANQTVTLGGNATFSVNVSSKTPAFYRWNLNGSSPSWATNTMATVTNVQLSDAGNYFVTVSNAAGLAVSSNALLIVAIPGTHYVDPNSSNLAIPYTNWTTAARTIQDAIDVAVAGDEIIVTNGVYATGGRAVYGTMTNRAAVDRPLTLRSVNGPEFTVIQGYQVANTTNGDGAIRCVYLAAEASLIGFTLTYGATRSVNDMPLYTDFYRQSCGGAVWCETNTAVVSNCVMRGNSAYGYGGAAFSGTLRSCSLDRNQAGEGGGAAFADLSDSTLTANKAFAGFGGGVSASRLLNCTVSGNSANAGGAVKTSFLTNCILVANSAARGGGAFSGILNNCLITRNHASEYGGGALGAVLNNCTVVSNTAISYGGGVCGYYWGHFGEICLLTNSIVYYNAPENVGWLSSLAYCCTTPLPTEGGGNLTYPPLFADVTGGDFHLQPDSHCINVGSTPAASGSTDLAGNPRIVGGEVDMGTYEYQSAQPLLWIAPAGRAVRLTWSLWASNFELQQATVLPPGPTDWVSSGGGPIIANGRNEVTFPIGVAPKLFRLSRLPQP